MNQYATIFEFTSFRKFIAEYQENRVREDSSFTRAEFCRQLGFPNTRSYVNDIVQGKRLSSNMQDRFLAVFELKPKEEQYFRSMVAFDQAITPLQKARAWKEMIAIHPTPETVLHSDSYEFYSKWYHSAIFVILDVLDINTNYEEVAKKIFPKIATSKVKVSIELLNKLGLVRKNAEGFWKPSKDRISTGKHNTNDFVKAYQKDCLDLSKQALASKESESKEMTALVFSTSKEARAEIELEIDLFMKKIRKIVSSDNRKPDVVEHLNLHLFSILKK